MQLKKQPKPKQKFKILVADREAVFRLGLKRLLSAEDDLRVVAQAEDASQVLAMLETFHPDVVIVQQEITAEGSGNLFAEIRQRAPECKIVATSSLFSEEMTKTLVEAGASGLIAKTDQPAAFVKRVHRVIQGEAVLPRGSLPVVGAGIVSDQDRCLRPVDTLTRRERTIVSCLTQGWRNREIASRLAITEQTVKNHLRSIYDKVGVSDRLELVLYAIHQKLELPSIEI